MIMFLLPYIQMIPFFMFSLDILQELVVFNCRQKRTDSKKLLFIKNLALHSFIPKECLSKIRRILQVLLDVQKILISLTLGFKKTEDLPGFFLFLFYAYRIIVFFCLCGCL